MVVAGARKEEEGERIGEKGVPLRRQPRSPPGELVLESGTLYQTFQRKRCLGFGAFGFVIKGIHYMDRACYAVKIVAFSSAELARVHREIDALAALPVHRNIVSYKGCWIERISEMRIRGIDSLLRLCSANNTSPLG